MFGEESLEFANLADVTLQGRLRLVQLRLERRDRLRVRFVGRLLLQLQLLLLLLLLLGVLLSAIPRIRKPTRDTRSGRQTRRWPS